MYTPQQLDGAACIVCGESSTVSTEMIGTYQGHAVIACRLRHEWQQLLHVFDDLTELSILEELFRLPSYHRTESD